MLLREHNMDVFVQQLDQVIKIKSLQFHKQGEDRTMKKWAF